MDDRDFVWWGFRRPPGCFRWKRGLGRWALPASRSTAPSSARRSTTTCENSTTPSPALLDRARGASSEAWPNQREELLDEFESACAGIREAFDLLHDAIVDAQHDGGIDDEIEGRIRSLRLSLRRALDTK